MVYEYVVVEFIEEKAVEIVPQLWIQSTTEGMYAYWPDCHSSMITHKVKKREIPDKENWKRYEVKIFSYTDTYEKALSRRKRAEYTSNVETDEDEENKREAGRPDRYNSSEDEDNSEPSQKKICLPTTQTNSTTTPQASSSGSTTPQASSSHSATPQASSSRSTTPQASSSRSTTPQASSSRSTTPQASSSRSTTPQSSSSRSTTPQTNYPPTPPPYQPFYSRTNERREPRILPDLPDCELDTPRSSRGGEINESFEKKVLIALARLQRQGEENSAILKQLRAGQSNAVNVDAADLDSLLTEVMKSKDDIDSISAQLQDANKKNQMTHALSILGGNTVGDTVRKMMRRLGNNALWSLYSLKGKKEKEAFQTTALYRVVVNCLYSGYEYIWQLDSCIMFYYSHLTWSDSKLRCVNDNGNLLTIETARKEYILLPFLMEKFEKQGLRFWWIGGTDAAQEGIFRWINGENVTYSNWDQSQPDDSSDGIPGADCIRYLIHSMNEAAWRDYDCNDQLRSICENKMFL